MPASPTIPHSRSVAPYPVSVCGTLPCEPVLAVDTHTQIPGVAVTLCRYQTPFPSYSVNVVGTDIQAERHRVGLSILATVPVGLRDVERETEGEKETEGEGEGEGEGEKAEEKKEEGEKEVAAIPVTVGDLPRQILLVPEEEGMGGETGGEREGEGEARLLGHVLILCTHRILSYSLSLAQPEGEGTANVYTLTPSTSLPLSLAPLGRYSKKEEGGRERDYSQEYTLSLHPIRGLYLSASPSGDVFSLSLPLPIELPERQKVDSESEGESEADMPHPPPLSRLHVVSPLTRTGCSLHVDTRLGVVLTTRGRGESRHGCGILISDACFSASAFGWCAVSHEGWLLAGEIDSETREAYIRDL
ncbi:hypothetical protein KIPB_002336 [Kipferlia bialata]|uniref:Uncharacterized protein n=1 Tax=Kipferlia bialata TaxID=797122 RepID=A0A9K3GGK4_9EUKA|nr:hypothetical protein KIPB_002336 [Kipferlia bialata]|eukprot:g2336.t1